MASRRRSIIVTISRDRWARRGDPFEPGRRCLVRRIATKMKRARHAATGRRAFVGAPWPNRYDAVTEGGSGASYTFVRRITAPTRARKRLASVDLAT